MPTVKEFEGIKQAVVNFIKERNYHLVEEEVVEAIKNALEEIFEQKNLKAIFDTKKMVILELSDKPVERDISWIFKFVSPRYLLRVIENHIDRYEREKIYSIFRPMRSQIIKADAVGETFHLGSQIRRIIDLKRAFNGTVYEFGTLHDIYVESGKEPVYIPSREWTAWNLAKYIFDKTGYYMSVNPHRKILRLKKQEKAVIFNVNGVDAIMPSDERIKGEDYISGREWEVILYNVNQVCLEGFQLYVSRRQIDFLVNYLYQYIPELKTIKVKAVAREPGVMAKVLIDRDGTNFRVGNYADVLSEVSNKLNGEKIEIVYRNADTEQLLRSALNHDGSVKVNSIDKKAIVITDRKGKAIGKQGVNVKLTGMLTGYGISVMTMDEYIHDSNIFIGG
jgi:transcription antitermination factor NusA-like protein